MVATPVTSNRGTSGTNCSRATFDTPDDPPRVDVALQRGLEFVGSQPTIIVRQEVKTNFFDLPRCFFLENLRRVLS